MTTIGLAITVRDGASTLDDALASVEAQTRRPDAVVLVDDGSTDGTAAVADSWRGRLPLEIVSQANAGVAAGRTAAVSRLDTDLVLGLDADDVWLPSHVERLGALQRERGGIAAPLALQWHPSGRRAERADELVATPPRDRSLASVLIMNWIFAGSLFERDAYDAVGGTFRFDGCEDWDLWLRLMRSGIAVHTLQQPTVRYRITPGSLSADDRTLPMECRVLEAFIDETDDEHLRRTATRSLRHRHARQALRRSYQLAADGERWAARSAALGTVNGPSNVRLRGFAMAFAPVHVARRRTELRDRS